MSDLEKKHKREILSSSAHVVRTLQNRSFHVVERTQFSENDCETERCVKMKKKKKKKKKHKDVQKIKSVQNFSSLNIQYCEVLVALVVLVA